MDENSKQKMQCPVCLMMVDVNSYAIEYQDHDYAFCSLQCQQRFKTNPRLYVGQPGHPAPKQHGHEIIKTRKLKLSERLTDDQYDVIESELKSMMGVKDVKLESDCLSISYDLLQATVEQITSAIENTGNRLNQDLGARLKLAFINYIEESELDNLEQLGKGHQH